MRIQHLFTLTAAVIFLLSGLCGCSVFRSIFGGKNISEAYKRESQRREQRKENRPHRDPVADMFDLQKMRDPAPKHMGISISETDKQQVAEEEKALERDRMRIKEYYRNGEDERRARTKWVVGL